MAKISVETFSETALEIFLDMTKNEYGPCLTSNAEHIRWKHLASPFGASICISLVEAGQVVGRALIQPHPMRTDANRFNIASVMDLLIEQKHRTTPANFISLTKASGNLEHYDLVFHTSNERTFPLYSKLFRFSNPFSLKAYGFPVRFAGVFSAIFGRRINAIDWLSAPVRWLLLAIADVVKFFSRLEISARAMDDEELETLSAKCLQQSGPHLVRTNAFLKWRFTDAPFWSATIFRIDRKGHFLGYAVTRKMELGGLSHLVLMDFMLDLDASFIARVALRFWLVRQTITSQADALFTMVNSYNSMARKVAGFPLMPILDRFLPHTTPIFIRPRSNDLKKFEADRSIHMTLADLDYF